MSTPKHFTPQWVADQLSQPFPDWRPFPEEVFKRLEQVHPQEEPLFAGTLMGKLALTLGCRSPEEWPKYDEVLQEWMGDAYIAMNAVERRYILDHELIRREMATSQDWAEVDQRMRDHFMAASQAFIQMLKGQQDEREQYSA